MKKLSDYIKFIKGYKSKKKVLRISIIYDILCGISVLLSGCINFYSIPIIFFFYCVASSLIFGLVSKNLIDLFILDDDYKKSYEAISSFAKKLNDKGIRISKDSLVKSNVHTNKHMKSMKIINVTLDGTEKDIQIIEEPRLDSIHENNNNLSMITSPKGMEESVYYVDKDLVADNSLNNNSHEPFNGNARIKRRNF